jgi:hypothetical protein
MGGGESHSDVIIRVARGWPRQAELDFTSGLFCDILPSFGTNGSRFNVSPQARLDNL